MALGGWWDTAASAMFAFPWEPPPELRESRALRHIAWQLDQLLQRQGHVDMDLSALTAAVANEQTVELSAITLLQTLSAQLTAAAGDPVAVQAIADQINSDAAQLASAVTINTPPVVGSQLDTGQTPAPVDEPVDAPVEPEVPAEPVEPAPEPTE